MPPAVAAPPPEPQGGVKLESGAAKIKTSMSVAAATAEIREALGKSKGVAGKAKEKLQEIVEESELRQL